MFKTLLSILLSFCICTASYSATTKSNPNKTWSSKSNSSSSKTTTKSNPNKTWSSSPKTATPAPKPSTPKVEPKANSNPNKTWGTSTKSQNVQKSTNSSTKTTAKPTMSAADQALYNKAKIQGTTYSDQKTATSDFKKKYSEQYSNTFGSEPSARPDYIPKTTTVSGQQREVVYIPSIRGYGYYDNGTPRAYDVMMDMAMLSVLMNRNGYYYGPPPSTQPVYESSDNGSAVLIVFGVLAGIVVVGIGGYALYMWMEKPNSRNWRF